MCSWRTLVSLHHQPRHVAACCVIAACAIAGVAVPPALWDLPAVQDLEPATVQGAPAEMTMGCAAFMFAFTDDHESDGSARPHTRPKVDE